MMLLHSMREDYAGSQAIFQIPIEGHSCVYMSKKFGEYNSDKRHVIIVEAQRFLELWRAEPHGFNSELAMGNAETWRNDYKFGEADKGFSRGLSNPVPLADVVCHVHNGLSPVYKSKFPFGKTIVDWLENKIDYVDFSNGITRTIWLLSHGARYFPVECDMQDGADRLVQLAGAGKGCSISVADLFGKN